MALKRRLEEVGRIKAIEEENRRLKEKLRDLQSQDSVGQAMTPFAMRAESMSSCQAMTTKHFLPMRHTEMLAPVKKRVKSLLTRKGELTRLKMLEDEASATKDTEMVDELFNYPNFYFGDDRME